MKHKNKGLNFTFRSRNGLSGHALGYLAEQPGPAYNMYTANTHIHTQTKPKKGNNKTMTLLYGEYV